MPHEMTPSELTAHDHAMFALAKARGQVVVADKEGDRQRLATLIAWKPRRNGHRVNKARVQFTTGTQASVPLSAVSADTNMTP